MYLTERHATRDGNDIAFPIIAVTGMPMGTTRASAVGAGSSVNSNRYVLNQRYTIKNISGAAITHLQAFQFLHGLTSQRGLYDNRAYAGKHSDYRYDDKPSPTKLWNVDSKGQCRHANVDERRG